ncbi:MAG: peptide deformylase [Pseudomonadota bacterium]
MAIREILTYPDPRLTLTASPVNTFDDSLQQLVDDMLETLAQQQAIGLSATQVDDQRNVLVIHPPGASDGPEVFINPTIVSKAMWGFVEESCLSVPGVVGSVIRATQVEAKAQDRTGVPFSRTLSGMGAVCLQHEMDHLNGKLFIDRFSLFGRWRAHRAARRHAAA